MLNRLHSAAVSNQGRAEQPAWWRGLGAALTADLGRLLTALLLASLAGAAQTVDGFSLTKGVSVSTIQSGVQFEYTLDYAFSSTTGSSTTTVISDILPASLATTNVSLVGTADIASSGFNACTRTATFTFINPLPSGRSGQLKILARFPNGTTPNNTVASNTQATMSSSNFSTVTASPVDITATAVSNWTIAKTLVNANGAALDQETLYQITLKCLKSDGLLNLTATTGRGVLPAGAVFVGASDGGVHSGEATGGTVTWTLGAITAATGSNAEATRSVYVSVRYPSSTFSQGQTVVNQSNVTGTLVGGGSLELPAELSHLTAAPSKSIAGWTKLSDFTSVKVGDPDRFEFRNNGTPPSRRSRSRT